MPSKLSFFKQLRPYKSLPLLLIFNNLLCNKLMKLSFMVDYAPQIYKWSSIALSRRFINHIVNSTYCKMFTAGNSIPEADEKAYDFRKENIPIILDYCAEGDIGHADTQSKLDANAALFTESAKVISLQKNEMISIKMTGLIDMKLLKKINDAVEFQNKFWKQNSQDGQMSYQNLVEGLTKVDMSIDQKDVQKYVKQILGFEGDVQNFSCDYYHFKINHYPYYLYEQQKNDNKIVRALLFLDKAEKQKIYNFRHRLNDICDPSANNTTNFRILVDAQQTYVQLAIQIFSQQMQVMYNKQRVFILPTIQNYLKRSVERSLYEIELAKRKNLTFAAKLVRGAYLVEETRLANQNKYENPIVEQFDDTTNNYLKSFELMVSSFKGGEIVVATHNEQTIQETKIIKSNFKDGPQVSFAQLMGLADHLTWKVKSEGFRVYKYLPWAETEVMIPYMIRRAQQLNQMRYPLDMQAQLLWDELKNRIIK